VIASQDEEILGVFDFVAKEKEYRLEALLASVHVVSKKKVCPSAREIRPMMKKMEQTPEIPQLV
jgi:hypothetical protein